MASGAVLNFYKRHLGDYAKDAGHLSMLEHGAYTLLLDRYYTTEKPLPTRSEAHRVCRARSSSERAAVDAVLDEFFVSDGEAFLNRRCEEEIAKAAHQRTVNQELGKRGGRPKKTDSETDSKTDSKTDSVPIRNPSQTPDSRLQTPDTKERARKRALPPPDGVNPQTWTDWLALRKAKKAPVTATVIANATAEAAKAGMSLESFLATWCARGSQGLQADWIKPSERTAANGGGETAWQRSQRERVAEMTGGLVSRKLPATNEPETIDAIPVDARLG